MRRQSYGCSDYVAAMIGLTSLVREWSRTLQDLSQTIKVAPG